MASLEDLENDKPQIVRAVGVERVLTTSDGFASYYANDTQIQTTPWDVRLSFGVIADVDATHNRVTVERLADVRLSPQHAKKLLEILAQQIAFYEATIGPIPLPVSVDEKK